MLAVAQIDGLARIEQGRARNHHTRRADDGDLHSLLINRVFVLDQGLPFLLKAGSLIAAAEELQQMIDLARRARDILLKSKGEVRCVLSDVAIQRMAFRLKLMPNGKPYDQKQHQAKTDHRLRQQRLVVIGASKVLGYTHSVVL